MLKRIIVASLLAASSLAQAENLVGKLLVLNPKGSQSGSVEIQPEQVNGILAGLMGFSGVSTVELPSTDSHANFLLVLDGAPLSTIQADSFSSSLSFDIKSSIQEAGSDLISRMISGKASDEEAEFSNLGDLLCQYHDNSAVFSISTHPNLGQAALPHDELSRNHPQWNIFGGDFDLQRSKAFVNGDKFLGAQKMVEGLFPMVKMGPNSESSSLFIREELALSRFLQSLEESEFASLLKDDSPDSITFISSSLTQIRKQYGGSSPQYLNAWSGFVSLIPKIHEQFLQAFGSDATFEVLFVESEAPVTINRSRRSAQKRDFTSIASNCFDTLEICQNSTSSCSGNGECQLAKQKADLSASCYRCKCSSDYAGESCEFINIVAPFHIIFWLSLAILISLALVCYSLAYMDPGTDTLLFRTSSKPKRE